MVSGRFFCESLGRVVIGISGDDRVSFLQALISNDVTALSPGQARWAALLTPQGKYLCDFFVIATPDRLLVDVEESRAEDLLARLKRYKLRAKVTLDIVPEFRVLLGWGEGALAALDLGGTGQGVVTDEVSVIVDPRLARLGIRVIGTENAALALLDQRGFMPSPFTDWDINRLVAGVPDGTRDLIPEQSILLEAGFDELQGVSWTKGCYIGQELTARTKYRALIKKRLLPVRFVGPAPDFGALVMVDSKEAGEIRSVSGDRGLALLRLECLDAGSLVSGAATITPEIPDWVNLAARPG